MIRFKPMTTLLTYVLVISLSLPASGRSVDDILDHAINLQASPEAKIAERKDGTIILKNEKTKSLEERKTGKI